MLCNDRAKNSEKNKEYSTAFKFNKAAHDDKQLNQNTDALHQVSPSICPYKITYLFSFFFWSLNISRISSPSFIEIIKKTHHAEHDSDFKNFICYM